VPISTTERNVNILGKISTLARKRQVKWTETAAIDILNEGLTREDILDAIISHIEEGGKVNKSITRDPPHTGKVIFEMLPVIEEKSYYVKVQLWGRKGDETLIVISAHLPRKGG
jgi:hypothetical protein